MLQVATANRPSVRFNPAGYKAARRSYDGGDAGPLIAMMQEASLDSHVAGCLLARRAGFKRAYSLVSPDDTDVATERRDWFTAVLDALDVRSLLEALHDGRLYVYNVVDFDWEVVGGRQVPTRWEAFEQHHFKRDPKDKQIKLALKNRLEDLPDTALVAESRRTPAMVPVLRDWILKEFGLEAWASFLENWGEPFLLAKYPPGSSPEYRKQIDDGLAALAASSRGSAPDGTSLEVHSAGSEVGNHDEFIDRADRGISITLLGHANAVEQRGGLQIGDHPSSYEVKHEVSVDDCYFLEPFVNRLIRTIGDRNFGDGRYPVFELHKAKPVDSQQHTTICETWWRMGLEIHPDEARKAGLYVAESQAPLTRSNDLSRLLD